METLIHRHLQGSKHQGPPTSNQSPIPDGKEEDDREAGQGLRGSVWSILVFTLISTSMWTLQTGPSRCSEDFMNYEFITEKSFFSVAHSLFLSWSSASVSHI